MKIALVILLSTTGLLLFASEDVEVKLPGSPEVHSSDEQIERTKVYRRVTKDLPYQGKDAYKALSTFGKLVKLSDVIFVGTVQKIKHTNVDNNAFELLAPSKIYIKAETYVWGTNCTDDVLINDKFSFLSRKIKPGDRILAFATKDNIPLNPQSIYKWNFQKMKPNITGTNDYMSIIGGEDRGCLKLNDKSKEAEVITVLHEYCDVLSKTTNTSSQYYELLRKLVLFENIRIKDDARSDLLNLCQTCPDFYVKRALADENIDNGIKDYLRFYWIPYVEKQNRR